MNEGHYIAIRNYLEEIAGQNTQLLAEQKRTNELLERGMSVTAIGEVVDKRMTELLEDIDKSAAAQGQKAAATSGDAPWPDYDSLNVGQIMSRIRNGPDDAALRARILAYERANKKRPGVITPLVNWNS